VDPARFYDDLAELYHLIYADWEGSVRRQATALGGLLEQALGPGPRRIADVACGIGTQALGLAALGHEVSASDLSPQAVARARREADARGVAIRFAVGDMRRCDELHPPGPDVVLAADNALPHLDADGIRAALAAFRRLVRPGGVALVSVRDYDREPLEPGLRHVPYGTRALPDGTTCEVFQTWDVRASSYDVTMSFVREREGRDAWRVDATTTYHPIALPALARLFRNAGFECVERLDGAFFQPVLLARTPSG